MRSEHLYLADIADAIASIERWMSGCDEARFLRDDILQSAVLQKLSTIGEAASRLSAETVSRAPQVPWKEIVGFRNVAVHAYFSVDWKVVYITVVDDLSALQEAVRTLQS
jgi:uncharacterized protein with HEPN domain